MAPSSSRKPAPAWPPFKDSYRPLGSDDDIQLVMKADVDTAATKTSEYYFSPTPRHGSFNNTFHSKWWYGWRGGAKIAFASAMSVLIINVVLLLAMTLAFPQMDGMSMIYIGSCTTSERINTGIHFVVNMLSTGLLAASNYCMQIMSAPTRNEVDRSHARGTWLDIGIASVRNLKLVRKQKVILWWLLAMSSIPLHLFYNSVFFPALAANDYNVLYATEDFSRGVSYDTNRFPDTKDLNVTDLQFRAQAFEKLDNQACVQAYAMDFVSDRRAVIAIVDVNATRPGSSSLLHTTANVVPPNGLTSSFDAFAWICDDPATPSRTGNSNGTRCSQMADRLEQIANTQWRSAGFDIKYCLSETIEADCHVHFAPQIMAPVLFFNIIKAAVIAYVAFFYKDKPIVTIGDAIESFSLKPDETTKGMCLATSEMIEAHWVKGYLAQPMRYDGRGRRWFHAVTWKQWLTFGSVFGISTVAVFVAIGFGIAKSDPSTIANAWSMGIGKVRTTNLIDGLQVESLGANAVLVSALVANAPQAMFSFIYLLYNNVFTTMVLSHEWDMFSVKSGKGKVLRVSDPRGDQKSTYFLQIPYRYAVIMLTTSGTLHWLVSQSVFLANVSIIPLDGIKPKQDEITTCSYSVKAMFFILVLGLFMLLWLFANGFRRFSGGMPFVGTNSAAISAACHPEYGLRCEREAMVLRPLRWGVTDYGRRKGPKSTPTHLDLPSMSLVGNGESSSRTSSFDKQELRYGDDEVLYESGFNLPVGHCAFTDGRVGKPISGRLYA